MSDYFNKRIRMYVCIQQLYVVVTGLRVHVAHDSLGRPAEAAEYRYMVQERKM